MDPVVAEKDFRERLRGYEKAYEPLDEERDESLAFIQSIDVGDRVIANRIEGSLAAQIVFYLMQMHIGSRRIWLTRHGQSTFNLDDRIGGDPRLTDRGIEYSRRLGHFLAERDPEGLQVWTSTLVRTICTASFLDNDDRFAGVQMHSLPALNELKAGVADGLTYAEVERLYPDMHKKREVNKLRFRNKDGGESYHDMMVRLEPIIFELERQREDVLVIAHRGSLRALYGYFLECSQDEVPYIDMPLDTVIELNVTAYGLTETRYNLFPEGDKMKPRKRSTKGSSQDEDAAPE